MVFRWDLSGRYRHVHASRVRVEKELPSRENLSLRARDNDINPRRWSQTFSTENPISCTCTNSVTIGYTPVKLPVIGCRGFLELHLCAHYTWVMREICSFLHQLPLAVVTQGVSRLVLDLSKHLSLVVAVSWNYILPRTKHGVMRSVYKHHQSVNKSLDFVFG